MNTSVRRTSARVGDGVRVREECGSSEDELFPPPPSSLVVGWADENCGSKTLPTSFEREDDWGCVFGLAYQAKDIVFRFIIEYMVA
jgi:hypothetical protein